MEPLLKVEDLTIDFYQRKRRIQAVKGISFELYEKEALAVVGESGSGKSVTALALTRLLPQPPICRVGGKIFYQGQDLMQVSDKVLRKVRGQSLAYVFQEPGTSLNPVFSVGYQIAEAVKLHLPEVQSVRDHVVTALHRVGIQDGLRCYYAYPHELSGGMQQRAMIAMALACKPKILVADEPTTALDVTIQKQIIDLLKELQKTEGMSVILITHNFGIVKGFAQRVVVMFRGKIVEAGETDPILYKPQHPYTKALIACIPRLGNRKKRLETIDYSKLDAQ